MTQKQNIRLTLIFGLFFISLGGWLIHYRFHVPSTAKSVNYIPSFLGLFNFAVLPWLFLFRRWVSFAYLVNGMTVIFGIIFMGHFSLVKHLTGAINMETIFLGTLLPDIIVLCSKFMLGKALFDLHLTQLGEELPLRFKPLRYPNMGWWAVHFIGIAAVYAIGAILLYDKIF